MQRLRNKRRSLIVDHSINPGTVDLSRIRQFEPFPELSRFRVAREQLAGTAYLFCVSPPYSFSLLVKMSEPVGAGTSPVRMALLVSGCP